MRSYSALSAFLLLCPVPALAQSRATSAIVPQDRPDQRRAAPTGGRAVGQLPRERAAAPIQPFTLTRVDIEGSTLPSARFAAAYAPFLGKQMDGAQLQAIVDAVAQVYAHSDIALYTVLVPSQNHEGGVLRLQAVEGYVENAVVRGANAKMRRLVGRYLAPVVRERPLTKRTLQRYVSLIRDVPGLYPDLNFERGDHPGAVRLVISAKPKPFQIGLGINDRGTALLGKTQGEVDGYANSLFVGGDQLRLTYARPIRAPYYQSGSIAYAMPLNADGLTLQVNAGKLHTRPHDLPLRGNATSLAAQISYAAVRSFTQNLLLSVGLDGVNSNNAFLGFTFSNEHTRALRMAATYSFNTDRNQLSATASQSFGLGALGARVLDPGLSQVGFRKTNIRLNDDVAIGKAFVLRVDAAAQISSDRLPATEQFTLGGDEFGRAYETALLAGDSGYAGSAEFAFRPNLPKSLAGSEVYAFVDGGHVRYHSRDGNAGVGSHLGSYGGGVRLAVLSRASFGVEAARGFDNPVIYEDRKKWRLLFSVRTLF